MPSDRMTLADHAQQIGAHDNDQQRVTELKPGAWANHAKMPQDDPNIGALATSKLG